jgi:hypothetical protein
MHILSLLLTASNDPVILDPLIAIIKAILGF